MNISKLQFTVMYAFFPFPNYQVEVQIFVMHFEHLIFMVGMTSSVEFAQIIECYIF